MFRSFRKKVHPSLIANEFAEEWAVLATDILFDFEDFTKEKSINVKAGKNEQQGEILALVSAAAEWVICESKFNSTEYGILLPYTSQKIGEILLNDSDWHPTANHFELTYDAHLRVIPPKISCLHE